MNVFENNFSSYNYEEKLVELSKKIEEYKKNDWCSYKNLEYIEYINEYVKNLIKLILYNSNLNGNTNYSDSYKYIYSRIGSMRAHNINEQEEILKIIKNLNAICDQFGCVKIKDANGRII